MTITTAEKATTPEAEKPVVAKPEAEKPTEIASSETTEDKNKAVIPDNVDPADVATDDEVCAMRRRSWHMAWGLTEG